MLITSLIGLISLLFDLKKNRKKIEFARDYKNKLHQYIMSQGSDHEVYGWLIHRSNKMQNQMGCAGIFYTYRPPFANYTFRNYPIILNMMPSLREAFSERFSSPNQQAESYASTLFETTVRHIGIIEDKEELALGRLKNPFVWFSSGVSLALSVPVRILGWFGLLGASAVGFLTSSFLFKTMTAIVSLVGFFSAVVGIVTGWEPFIAWIQAHPFIANLFDHLSLVRKLF